MKDFFGSIIILSDKLSFGKRKLVSIKIFISLLLNLFLFISTFTYCTDNYSLNSYITTQKANGAFCVFDNGKASPLYVSKDDYPGVIRAAKDLQRDIQSVCSVEPQLSDLEIPKGKTIIIIGTLGKSLLIDKFIKEKKLDPAPLKGKWESFIIQAVKKPMEGIDEALIIAGSDKRGTIYGIYDFSEKIGVSPWYWWADVPVAKKKALYVAPGIHTLGEPAVKYRGFFINDEFPSLGGWAMEKFGGFNHKFYTKVFELLLRLKANYLWPAMWNNNFYDEDSLNSKLADEYGIVMGTSHHEPMMRSWKEWPKYGHGVWNYQTNDSVLKDYWKNGIRRTKNYESIVTMGMRGDGDEEMSASANIGLLEKIISTQRIIISEVTGKDVTSVPQVWTLYKEVMEYYEKGLHAPDDITLMFADDNWGNLRRLPKPGAPARKGGYGIYYHFDYVGGPRNYKWLNTIQIERVWEQMRLAYKYGADKIWIVNVGDIKPLEFPISFFMDYAWNPDKIKAEDLPAYYCDWSQKQFGKEYAKEIGDILYKYTKFNSRVKPELLSPGTYSLVNYNEAENTLLDYKKVSEKASDINAKLKPEYRDAYYQLVLYPVFACYNLHEIYFNAAKNRLYYLQGRRETNNAAQSVKEFFEKDSVLTNHYNKILAGGKWNHIMDQTHIGYNNWQQPDKNNMPEIKQIEIPDSAEIGITAENSENWFPAYSGKLALPMFDSFNRQKYFVELFNRSKAPFTYKIKTEAAWIKIDYPTGKVESQEKINISIDWNKIPAEKNNAVLSVEIDGKKKNEIMINAVNTKYSGTTSGAYFESNGYVSIEAEHYTGIKNTGDIVWEKIPGLGRTSSAMNSFPLSVNSNSGEKNSSVIEYKFYSDSPGVVNVNCYFSPTLKFLNKDIKYSIAIDDEKPQIINMAPNKNPADLNKDLLWNKWVSENINIRESKHEVLKPGEHVLKISAVDPGIVLQKIVIDFGGAKPCYLGAPESFRIIKNVKK